MNKIILGVLAIGFAVSTVALADASKCGPYSVDFRDIDSNLDLTLPGGSVETLIKRGSSKWETKDGTFVFTETQKLNGNVVSTTSTLTDNGHEISCN